jgi:hypothetical protein
MKLIQAPLPTSAGNVDLGGATGKSQICHTQISHLFSWTSLSNTLFAEFLPEKQQDEW